MSEHRYLDVFVCDAQHGRSVVGHVAACTCGWSGMKILDYRAGRKQWRGHEAARSYWDPIVEERRRNETDARVAAAVLARVTNPCPRCQHMHMRDPVWTCNTDCRTCNPGLADKSYGPEYVERLRARAETIT